MASAWRCWKRALSQALLDSVGKMSAQWFLETARRNAVV